MSEINFTPEQEAEADRIFSDFLDWYKLFNAARLIGDSKSEQEALEHMRRLHAQMINAGSPALPFMD